MISWGKHFWEKNLTLQSKLNVFLNNEQWLQYTFRVVHLIIVMSSKFILFLPTSCYIMHSRLHWPPKPLRANIRNLTMEYPKPVNTLHHMKYHVLSNTMGPYTINYKNQHWLYQSFPNYVMIKSRLTQHLPTLSLTWDKHLAPSKFINKVFENTTCPLSSKSTSRLYTDEPSN